MIFDIHAELSASRGKQCIEQICTSCQLWMSLMIVSIMVMAGSTTWQGTQAPALTQAASELVLRTHASRFRLETAKFCPANKRPLQGFRVGGGIANNPRKLREILSPWRSTPAVASTRKFRVHRNGP